MTNTSQRTRTWEEIALQLCNEQDSDKCLRLAEELNMALEYKFKARTASLARSATA